LLISIGAGEIVSLIRYCYHHRYWY